MDSMELPYILMTVGLLIIVFLAFVAFKANKSQYWNITQGYILHKGTKIIERKGDSDSSGWKSIHLDVEFEYEVDGQLFHSKRTTFSDFVNKPVSALDNILKYHLNGELVQVYYNPENPKDSVIIPGIRVWNFTPMVTGLGFICSGLLILLQT
ncbi:MAG: DUF3592 domain-containing protein [Moritella sp.]|uniref:DUF3592 domain-containing protein n=1 Tax=Moritella sp. TaxID=78556 RepID=UPI001D65E312|nr:DUF3592 domain-containing protein [Moritella sp.]NQZ51935.1 DUF3592 domain-containing protein [Moritella sp.]